MKRRKGLSLEEKKERMLRTFQDRLEVFNFKEIEKFSVKLGIVPQSVKDVLDMLIADALVSDEKIGGGRFYWSFPSQALKAIQHQESVVLNQLEALNTENEELNRSIERAREQRKQTARRGELEARVAKAEEEKGELDRILGEFELLSPRRIGELDRRCEALRQAANDATDNIYTVQSWLLRSNPAFKLEDVNRHFNIPEELDSL